MKFPLKSQRYTRLFYNWMISYSSILIIPLILIIISYFVSIRAIESEISKANHASINQVKHSLDNIFYDVRRISNSLLINDEIMSIINSKAPLTNYQRFSLYKLSTRLKDYRAGNSYVDDYFIYSKNNDFILNSTGYMSTYDYYEYKDNFGFETYEDWMNFLHTNSKYEFHHVRLGVSPKGSRIIYTHTLPLFSHGEQMGALVISLNEGKLQTITNSMVWSTASDIVILDAENRIVLSTEATLNDGHFIGLDFADNWTFNNLRFNDKEVVLTSVQSDVANFKYVFVIPKSIYMGKINRIRYLTIFSITLCLIVGGFLSFFYSRKNYSPINSIINILLNDKELLSYDNKDEIKFITSSLKWIIEERKKNKELLIEQRKLIRNNFLVRLINGKLDNELKIKEALNSYQICFNSEYFAVLTMYLETTIIDDKKDDTREPLGLIIQKAFNEFFAPNYNIHVLELDEYYVVLLNHKNYSIKQQVDSEITKLSYKVKSFLDNNFGLFATIAISKTHKGVTSLPLCYKEALKAMEYRMLLGSGEIIHYEEIQNNKINIFKTYYTLEDEQKLAYSIKTGDFNRAREIILEVINNISCQEEMSIELIKCAIFSMINTMLSSLANISGNVNSNYLEELHPSERVLNCRTIEEMKSTIVDIFDKISDRIEKDGAHKRKYSDIIRFIHDNYSDYEMNVSMISEIFNINISYLSRMFKAYQNENISEYINRFRVEKSKELLLDQQTSMSIKEIASKCGFYNSNTYIRVFKKYMGMTPGAFKSKNIKKNTNVM